MTTDTEITESLCRELAERKVNGLSPNGIRWDDDPRFEALRREHEWHLSDGNTYRCWHCREWKTPSMSASYCLRTDLGAMIAVVTAHGFPAIRFGVLDKYAECHLRHTDLEGMTEAYSGVGTSPELAAIRALKEAVDAGTR